MHLCEVREEQDRTNGCISTFTLSSNSRFFTNFTSEQIHPVSGTPMTMANIEKSGLAALPDFADGSGAIKLESALERRVTEECLSMYNVDGSMRKASMSTLLHMFNLDPVPQMPLDHISLADMARGD